MKTTEILTLSAAQNPIELITLGRPENPKILLVGGMHGDEPEGSTFVQDFIENSAPLSEKFRACFLAIPRYNPDGLIKNERTNGRGVDLNRNFPSQDWSGESSGARYFPGHSPSSEPETKALVRIILEHKPFLIVHVHTYIPQINYSGERSRSWAEMLAKNFGHPVTDNIGYPTPGSLGQFCHLDLQIPCICVELPEKVTQKKAWDMMGSSLMEIGFIGKN